MRPIRQLVVTLLVLGGVQLLLHVTHALNVYRGPSYLQWPESFPMSTSRTRKQSSTRHVSDATLEAKLQSYYQFGFPKAGRSLTQKIQEADAFLKRDIATSRVVGVGASIVYNDQVVLAKGYGLRQSSDKTSVVTPQSLFQIGSVTKSMIAVAIGLLVEDGKVQWTDAAKTHLPWLTLSDKYAEATLTIGNLLSMNSGFGRTPDMALFTGLYADERKLVEAMGTLEPESAVRSTPAYGNINFEVLGQLIEAVSGQPWYVFLQDRVWGPLGMKHTYASASVVPATLQKTALNYGHEVCVNELAGPFDLTSSVVDLTAGMENAYIAAGSVVSSASDMATFARLLLNKGHVGNVAILNAASTVTEMSTGKNVAALLASDLEFVDLLGMKYIPGGNSFAAGYGFDFIGELMWGRPYYDKGGDTFFHHTDTGFAPREGLGVVLMANSQGPHSTLMMSQARSYVMGIFLDVPKNILDYQLQQWRAALPPLDPPFPGFPACGASFLKNVTRAEVDAQASDQLIGTYRSTVSGDFQPTFTVSTSGSVANVFNFQVGNITGSFYSMGNVGTTYLFVTQNASASLPAFLAVRDETPDGAFSILMGPLIYRKL